MHLVFTFLAPTLEVAKLVDYGDFFEAVGWGGGNNSAYIAFIVYYFALPVKWRELAIVALIALGTEWIFREQTGVTTVWAFFSSTGWVSGCVFTAAIVYRAVFDKANRQRALGLLTVIVLLISLSLIAFWMMQVLNTANPLCYDLWALIADGAWGFQPAIEIAKFQGFRPTFEHAVLFFYVKLAVWQAIATVLVLKFPRRSYNNVLAASFALGVCALTFYYHILPMIGINVLLGGVEVYPTGPVPELTSAPTLVAAGLQYPRTCAPSMHTAWILSAFFAVFRMHRSIALIGGVVVFMTLCGTLNRLIGHYLLDLVAAVPLTVACQALTAWPRPGNLEWRMRTMLFGFLSAAGFLYFIRFCPGFIFRNPALFVIIQLVLVGVSFYLESKLAHATLSSDEESI